MIYADVEVVLVVLFLGSTRKLFPPILKFGVGAGYKAANFAATGLIALGPLLGKILVGIPAPVTPIGTPQRPPG